MRDPKVPVLPLPGRDLELPELAAPHRQSLSLAELSHARISRILQSRRDTCPFVLHFNLTRSP